MERSSTRLLRPGSSSRAGLFGPSSWNDRFCYRGRRPCIVLQTAAIPSPSTPLGGRFGRGFATGVGADGWRSW
jgi:hypothetical protein